MSESVTSATATPDAGTPDAINHLSEAEFTRLVETVGKASAPSAPAPADADSSATEAQPEPAPDAVAVGLKAELTRVRAEREEERKASQELRERLARLEGAMQERKQADGKKPVSEFSDDELIELKYQWDQFGDEKASEGDQPSVKLAKANLKAIDREILARAKGKGASKDSAGAAPGAADSNGLIADWNRLYNETLELVPDVKDQNSEMWKAAKAEYDADPRLAKFGGLGEGFALLRAVIKTKNGATKTLVKNLEDVAGKSLSRGAKSGGSKTGTPLSAVDIETMPVEQFEQLVDARRRESAMR